MKLLDKADKFSSRILRFSNRKLNARQRRRQAHWEREYHKLMEKND